MKSSRLLIIVVILVLAAIGFYSLSSGSTDEEYKAAIIVERQKKDEFMKNSGESPFAAVDSAGADQGSFSGLKYFEPDPKYRVKATLQAIENKKVVDLPTSDGNQNRYLEFARAEFELDGIKNNLLILEVMDMGPTRGTLFLAFADGTSANETYGAGRYLELKKIPGATSMTLDFNNSYNPYCAYVDRYSCPFPPRENILKVAIQAGEKNYH